MTTFSDSERDQIRDMAKHWRNAVLRGDVSSAFAAEDVAGRFTYPYADAARYESAKKEALRALGTVSGAGYKQDPECQGCGKFARLNSAKHCADCADRWGASICGEDV